MAATTEPGGARVELHGYRPGCGRDGDQHVADLHRPDRGGPAPVVVLVHGGFWRAPYRRDLMSGLAHDLAGRGWAAFNIDYCRVGDAGGGWPGTLADVAAAVDHLAGLAGPAELDLARVLAVGHSAGGQLALWLAGRPGLPASAPGAAPAVRVSAAVSQAGVCDLVSGADLGRGAARELLGGAPEQLPERYLLASPQARLPLGVPGLLVHGDADDRVPVTQSRGYAAAAAEHGERVELVELAGVGHFEHLDPGHPAWQAVLGWLDRGDRVG